jgi:transcriptional regulator with XRE-family HTH domain
VRAQLDDFPELSTSDHWRALMKRSREAQKLTQRDLARKISVTQPTISGIESGKIESSRAIQPICTALKIPPPHFLFEDEAEARWAEAGRRIRAADPRAFTAQLAGIEQLAAILESSPAKH